MIKNIFKPNNRKLLICVAIYRIILDFIFKNVLAAHYEYYSFVDNSNIIFFAMSWFILIIFSLIISYSYKNTKTVTNQILFFLFLISFVPFTTMVGYGNFDFIYVIANCSYFTVLFLFNQILWKKIKQNICFRFPTLGGETNLKIIGFLSFLVIIYISGEYTDFRFSLGISNSLKWRYAARDFDLPTIFRYFFSWTKCINSILMVYFILKRKIIWTLSCVFMQILAFGVNGMKFTLFFGMLAFIIACLPKINAKNVGQMYLTSMLGFIILCILEFLIFRTYVLSSLIVMRILFIPNLLGFQYFTFFSTHVPDYFRGSFLRYFGFTTPYPNLQFYITEYFTGDSKTGSNSGLIADAMTNLGYIGIFVFPILLIIILSFLDKTMDGLDTRIKIAQTISLSLLIISTFLCPLLLTDGLLIMMILFNAMKKTNLVQQYDT